MEKEKEESEELVIVTDRAENMDAQSGSSMEIDDTPPKKEVKDTSVEDEEDEEDARLGASEETEAEEEAKQKERASHKSRRQRRKEAENRLRTELRFLETRNDKLERTMQDMARRMDSTEKTSLDGRVNQTKSLIAKAESVIAEAMSNNKGVEAVEATRIRDKLRDDLRDLEQVRSASEVEERTTKPSPNPRVVSNVRSWHERNSWYDFQARDPDSKIVRAIDDSLAEEGFDPAGEDYWKELDKRVSKYLPHRVKKVKPSNGHDTDEEDDEEEEVQTPVKRKTGKTQRAGFGGPRFRTGGPGRELGSNEVYLNSERIQALKDAGVWDDPKAREKYLKRYRDYDREHGNS